MENTVHYINKYYVEIKRFEVMDSLIEFDSIGKIPKSANI